MSAAVIPDEIVKKLAAVVLPTFVQDKINSHLSAVIEETTAAMEETTMGFSNQTFATADEPNDDPTAWMSEGSVPSFLLMHATEIQYLCMFAYTFYHGMLATSWSRLAHTYGIQRVVSLFPVCFCRLQDLWWLEGRTLSSLQVCQDDFPMHRWWSPGSNFHQRHSRQSRQ
jgi:hypothetical protein